MRRIGRGERGFTLVELLVVVGILAVLAAIVVPAVSSFVGQGSQEAANTELENIQTAMDVAMADLSLTTVNANVGGVTDFTAPAVDNADGDIDDGATIVGLYPGYLRKQTAGHGTYTWDTTGLVTQTP